MSSNEQRFYKPAPYTREVDAKGNPIPGKVRRVYHPRRHPSHPLRTLADGGEVVAVRPNETGYWMRLEQQGDVERGSDTDLKAALDKKAKKDAEAAAEKAKKDAKKAATKESEG